MVDDYMADKVLDKIKKIRAMKSLAIQKYQLTQIINYLIILL